jgi:hypothetical protein
LTRFYLDTSAHIERWGGEQSIKDEIRNLLGDEAHATSTHARREWKRIVEGGAAAILNAYDEGDRDLASLFARVSQAGYGRSSGQTLRVISMLTAGEGVIDLNITTRARLFVRTLARKLFESQMNVIRDGSECGLALNEPIEDSKGRWSLVDRCKKTDNICRQVEFIEERKEAARHAGEALRDLSPRDGDQQMGETVLQGLKVPADRKGRNCYGRTGDVSIALECASDETLLTTDASFDVIAPALKINLHRLAPTRGTASRP